MQLTDHVETCPRGPSAPRAPTSEPPTEPTMGLTTGPTIEPTPPLPGACVAECLDARHPTLVGRVLARWELDGHHHERWVPTLQGLALRAGDRLLLLPTANASEPVVIGVLDGFTRRPAPTVHGVAQLELQPDERVAVSDARGRPLLEVVPTDAGPTLRLLNEDLDLELPGRLRFRASQIVLDSVGAIDVRSEEDVVIRGEVIHLNP